MSTRKTISLILIPCCIAFFVYTLYQFFLDVNAWRGTIIDIAPTNRSPGGMVFYSLLFFILKNIPNLIILNFCRKSFES